MTLITTVLVPPNRNMEPAEFASVADTFVADLPTWTEEVNDIDAYIASAMSAISTSQSGAVDAAIAAINAQGFAENAQAASETARDKANEWAEKTTPVETGQYSAKQWATGDAPPDGSSKEWATKTGSLVDATEYSAKEYASGSFVPTGSAKEWAITPEDTLVDSDYSAKHYAAKAAASVAVLPEGTINDGLIASDKAWSSEKISSELAVVSPVATIEKITSSQTWVAPRNMNVKIKLWGGGGSGGYDSPAYSTPGAGGGYCEKTISVTKDTGYSITIGSGGASVSSNSNGNQGGTTSFASECSATGGAGGILQTDPNYYITGVVGGFGIGGDINIKGSEAGIVYGSYNLFTVGVSGPSAGQRYQRRQTVAIDGESYGYGGYAFTELTTSSTQSGAGADGLCILEY